MKIYSIQEKPAAIFDNAAHHNIVKNIMGAALLAISIFTAIFINAPLGIGLGVVSLLILASEPHHSRVIAATVPTGGMVFPVVPAHQVVYTAPRRRRSDGDFVPPPETWGPRVPAGTARPTFPALPRQPMVRGRPLPGAVRVFPRPVGQTPPRPDPTAKRVPVGQPRR